MTVRNIFPEFNDKHVEVFTNKTSFSGMFAYDDINCVAVVTPIERHIVKRYGPAFIDVMSIIAIRLIKPVEKSDYKDHELHEKCSEDSDSSY